MLTKIIWKPSKKSISMEELTSSISTKRRHWRRRDTPLGIPMLSEDWMVLCLKDKIQGPSKSSLSHSSLPINLMSVDSKSWPCRIPIIFLFHILDFWRLRESVQTVLSRPLVMKSRISYNKCRLSWNCFLTDHTSATLNRCTKNLSVSTPKSDKPCLEKTTIWKKTNGEIKLKT